MLKKLVVNGFSFENQDAYNDAQKEAEAISYIKAKTDMDNTTNLVKLYNNLIDKQTFITPVGIGFLKELYDKIIASGVIAKDNLRPVPVKHTAVIVKEAKGFEKEGESNMKMRLSYTESKLKNSQVMNVFFVIIILVLFAITIFSDRSPFVNAELRFQDKYASWAEELTERENIIKEKEEALGITK